MYPAVHEYASDENYSLGTGIYNADTMIKRNDRKMFADVIFDTLSVMTFFPACRYGYIIFGDPYHDS